MVIMISEEEFGEEGVSKDKDFIKMWLEDRFSKLLDEEVGEKLRTEIMDEWSHLSNKSLPEEKARWLKGAMERLETSIEDYNKRKGILNDCGCLLTGSIFDQLSEKFNETKDIDEVLKLNHTITVKLHKKAHEEGFWNVDAKTLELVKNNPLIESGVRKGNKIYIQKVPHSSTEYNQTNDEMEKRKLYCHCPWIRNSINTGVDVSPLFCECSGGFYKKFWERIVQQPLEIEMVKSILNGDNTCDFIIHIPKGIKEEE